MIVVKIQGGLGNQMFQYALGRRLSLHKNEPLFLDTDFFNTKNSATKRTYSMKSFSIMAQEVAPQDRARFLRYRRQPSRMHNFFFSNPRKYVTEKTFAFDPQVLELGPDIYLDGYWQTEKYFADIRATLLEDFSIPRPSASLQKFMHILQEIPNPISLHVRRGDYVHNPETAHHHGALSAEYYASAMDLMQRRFPSPTYVCFSDDPEWVRHQIAPDRAIYAAEYGLHDFEEMHGMAQCKAHIIANSSFSWWGAWLNPDNRATTVAPKKWFNTPRKPMDTSDLIPDRWITI